jgi:hypothetical protein
MGWTKEIQKEGAGPKPTRGKTVFVHCTGVVKESGHTFWSTKWDASKGGGVFSFKLGLGQVIPVSSSARINPLSKPRQHRRSTSKHHNCARSLPKQAWDEGVATMSTGESAQITATHEVSQCWSQCARREVFSSGQRPSKSAFRAESFSHNSARCPLLVLQVAYGEAGFPAWGIPPRATLVFDIELLRFE